MGPTWSTNRRYIVVRGNSNVVHANVPWVSLQGQFGSNYAADDQGMRDFKRAFLRELKQVLVVYPEAKVSDSASGLVMHSSPPHVPFDKKKSRQRPLTF